MAGIQLSVFRAVPVAAVVMVVEAVVSWIDSLAQGKAIGVGL